MIATTRTAKNKQKLLDAGADYVIATQKKDLVAKVMEITSGHDADLIFAPIAGSIVKDLANLQLEARLSLKLSSPSNCKLRKLH